MDIMETLALCALGLFALVAAVRLVQSPAGLAVRLAVNTALGFGALWLTSYTAGFTGIALGVNLWNALFIAVLGLPGFVCLLLMQWVGV